MGTPVDFDLAVLILRVLEGLELGNSGLYRNYWPYVKILKKSKKFKMLFWSRESIKPIFMIFPDFFYEKWAGNLGITSETTWESRVRRPGRGPSASSASQPRFCLGFHKAVPGGWNLAGIRFSIFRHLAQQPEPST